MLDVFLSVNASLAQTREIFNVSRTEEFARDDQYASAHAPGRVELLGNHTDYNEGVVLGAAIDRGINVAGSRRDDGMIQIHSRDFGRVEIPLFELRPRREDRWANYALGVVRELIDLGAPVTGFDAEITGDVPIGAGLSSSAAFELATALFLLKLFPREVAPLEIAKACQRAEHRYVGVQSGLLDQVIALFGQAKHAVFFDCRSEEILRVPFPSGLALIVAESGKERALASGEYNLRREETHAAARALGVPALRDVTSADLDRRSDLPDLIRRRAAHVVGENERVWRAVKLLEAGDGIGFGRLMNESHESSRQNFDNSTPELDLLVSIAEKLPGVLGARLTGAGFGGAIVVLCEKSEAQSIAIELSQRYFAAINLSTLPFVCRLGDGAA
ncbi:MAG TPA: galactokinase [Chthoniobacterales bacterium]|nr:galactokinase [Chthoniobacterales bacterium]